MNKNVKDRTGLRYGRFVAVEFSHSDKGRTYWKCICDCGNEKVVRIGSLISGGVKSCGCLQKELRKKWAEEQKKNPSPNNRNYRHGLAYDRFYNIWKGMKNRCYNEKASYYERYGGRGIVMSKRWMDFENFKEDMHESYLIHEKQYGIDTTIERINVDGNYESSNCEWATNIKQQRNRANTKYVEYNNEVISVPELSGRCGIPLMIIHNRLRAGWDMKKIVSTPVRNKKRLHK